MMVEGVRDGSQSQGTTKEMREPEKRVQMTACDASVDAWKENRSDAF